MYQLVSAIVKPLNDGRRWRAMDIGNVSLRDLFNNFKQVRVRLSNEFLTSDVGLDIEVLRSELAGDNQTFNSWLVQNGNKSLPTTSTPPVLNTRYAHFSDAVRSGYKVVPTHPTISPTSPLAIEERTDLVLTREGANYEQIYRHCLLNVNGFYHQTDFDPNGVYVTDGMKTCLRSRRNEVGILSFLALGELSFIQIQDEMIYGLKENSELRYNCYIDTGVDLSTKTVMLVLGGYLHILDKRVFWRTSPSAFGVDFGQIPLVDRFFESSKVLDLSSLELATNQNNPDQISINNLFSDAVLRKYLTLSQSFFVVLDNDDIFLSTIELRHSPFPGTYTSFAPPIYPLLVGHGRHEIFWPRKENDRYSVNINATWNGTRAYATVATRKQKSVDDAEIPVLGYRNDSAHFLLIGSDL